MKHNEAKMVGTDKKIMVRLILDPIDNFWFILEGNTDTVSFEEYQDAKQEYDSIIDIPSLIKIFGWTTHPYTGLK